MKKVALIIDSLEGAEAERVVVTLAKGFSKLSCEVHIIILDDIVEYEIPNKVSLHLLKSKDSISLKSLILDLEDNNHKKFDLIFSHLHSNIKIVKNSQLQNLYYIFHIPISRRFYEKSFLSRFLKKIKLQYRFKDENLIAVSEGIKKDIIEHGFKPKMIQTIYNPSNFEEIIASSKLEDLDIPKEPYIINVARFHPQKRHDILLKAFAKSGLKCKLLLIGKGSQKESKKIKLLISELKLESKVTLVGFKKNPFPLMKNARVFVLSSDFEGFGLVIVESLILNTPVVSTNCKSGPGEIMVGNLAKYLVPVGDVDELSNMMQQAFNDKITIDQKDLNRFKEDIVLEQYLKLGQNR